MKFNQNLLADLFQSNMVLPVNMDFKIGGEIKANQEVNITFNKKRYQTVSNNTGEWQITLPAINNTDTIAEITVNVKGDCQQISNIHFGMVYLLSGQSNIEFRLKDEANYSQVLKDLKSNKYDELYYYNVPQIDYIDPINSQVKPNDLHFETWHKINVKNCGMVSAIGFYMMKAMRKEGLTCPIAVVDCYKGGTSASSWVKTEDLANDLDLNRTFLEKYNNEIANKTIVDFNRETAIYNKKVNQHKIDLKKYLKEHPRTSLSTAKNIVGHTPWPPPVRPDLFTRPGGLYETMVKQVRYGIFNGMVWYQGENDTDNAAEYSKLLPILIKTWRRELQDPSLPIKLIQLPGYADYPENAAAVIRQTQLDVAANTPGVDLVSFIDGGEEHNIHPENKKIMGKRLGKILVGNDYAGTPYVDQIKFNNGKLILTIARCLELKLIRKAVLQVTILDKKYDILLVNNHLAKNEIIVSLNQKPTMISYAYTNFTKDLGLYNELNYPVSPFRIEL